MGLFSGTPNRNGFLNRIANPDPSRRGLLNRIANPVDDPNGGLVDKLFGAFGRKPANNNTNQPQNFQDPNQPTGGSW